MSHNLNPPYLTQRFASREQARALNEQRYFSGEPCFYGHITQRYTDSGRCVTCQRDKKHDWEAMLAAAQLEDSEPFYRVIV